MTLTLTIRPLAPTDLPRVVRLIEGLARFHGDSARIDPATLQRDALGEAPWLRVLVAEEDGTLVGYAALLPTAQLQFGARGMDLHHIYVPPARRGDGIGTALFEAAQRVAREAGCTYFVVGTDPGNTAAARFYEARGMTRRAAPGPRFILRMDQPPT